MSLGWRRLPFGGGRSHRFGEPVFIFGDFRFDLVASMMSHIANLKHSILGKDLAEQVLIEGVDRDDVLFENPRDFLIVLIVLHAHGVLILVIRKGLRVKGVLGSRRRAGPQGYYPRKKSAQNIRS